MKKILIYIGVLLIVIAAFILGITHTGGSEVDFWVELKKLSPEMIILFILISFINFSIFTYRWQVILHTGDGAKVPLSKMMWYRFVGYAVSYVTPVAQLGGEPFRMYFLEQHGVTRKRAISSVINDKVFETTAFSIFAAVAIAAIIVRGNSFGLGPTIPLLIVLFLLGLFYYLTIAKEGFFTFFFRLFKLHRVSFFERIGNKILETEQHMKKFFHQHTGALIGTITISLVTLLIILLEYWFLLTFIGIQPTFSQLLIVSAIPMIGYIAPIPGAVGSLEFAQWSAFGLAGFDPWLSIPALVTLRARDLFFVFLGILYASTHGVNIVKQEIDNKKIEN